MPELPEMEILSRRLNQALAGKAILSVKAPGVNLLRTYNPPLQTITHGKITEFTRRGKLLITRIQTQNDDDLALITHLMSAGRIQVVNTQDVTKRGRDRTLRLSLLTDDGNELRLREFGSKQAAWVKLIAFEQLPSDESVNHLGPDAWPGPLALSSALNFPRPLHSLLRDQKVVAGIGRTWSDEILHRAKLSPFKRGNDLDGTELDSLESAIVAELERVIDSYVKTVKLPLPQKFPKPTRVHGHQNELCYRCQGPLSAVFFEDYTLTYCPQCQTDGKILKDRRLSRLLK